MRLKKKLNIKRKKTHYTCGASDGNGLHRKGEGPGNVVDNREKGYFWKIKKIENKENKEKNPAIYMIFFCS